MKGNVVWREYSGSCLLLSFPTETSNHRKRAADRPSIVSRHKFASNVCEKALTKSTGQDLRDLITELIGLRPDGTNNVRMLLQDAFGNFPLQVCHSRAHYPSIEMWHICYSPVPVGACMTHR